MASGSEKYAKTNAKVKAAIIERKTAAALRQPKRVVG